MEQKADSVKNIKNSKVYIHGDFDAAWALFMVGLVGKMIGSSL